MQLKVKPSPRSTPSLSFELAFARISTDIAQFAKDVNIARILGVDASRPYCQSTAAMSPPVARPCIRGADLVSAHEPPVDEPSYSEAYFKHEFCLASGISPERRRCEMNDKWCRWLGSFISATHRARIHRKSPRGKQSIVWSSLFAVLCGGERTMNECTVPVHGMHCISEYV